ncbi:helix-turn-helix domain-containing protein [Candidatus Micrarchaeota archaeon]|nr:helix-turn-helix domain-containing protein [Candidatus Micrarchaeota archaeon]
MVSFPVITNWKTCKRRKIPVWVIIELSRLLDISPDHIETKIIGYGNAGRSLFITGNFPIKISPEFDSVVSNFMGDGSFGNIKSLPNYKQKNELGRRIFLTKLYNVFGKFCKNDLAYDTYWQVRIPKIIGEIIKKYYQISPTDSLNRRLPNQMKNKSRNFKIAILASFIVDEGHIGDSIEIYSGNKALLQDYLEIAESLEYRCTEIKKKKGHLTPRPSYRFRISARSSKKILADLEELKQEYPNCSLAHKQKQLEQIVRKQEIQFKRCQSRKQDILKLLDHEVNTINKLKEILPITGTTISEHLRELENKGLIERVGKVKDADIWKRMISMAPNMQGKHSPIR